MGAGVTIGGIVEVTGGETVEPEEQDPALKEKSSIAMSPVKLFPVTPVNVTAYIPERDVLMLASSHLLPLLPLAENTVTPLMVTFSVPMVAPYIW